MPLAALQAFFNRHTSVALGFSGGVDSAYLLYAGIRCGAKIQPYFVKTAFQPAFELADAERVCKQLNVEMTVIQIDALAEEAVASNPADRCYFCKKRIFTALRDRAAVDGFTTIIDGTNASDDPNDRAGTRALAEQGVLSPLRDCGFTKEMIRHLSKEAGLFTWEKPAYACLATRIPTGRRITNDLLTRVETAEDALFSLGFSDFRVRVAAEAASNDSARLQLPPAQMPAVIELRTKILEALTPLFDTVTLDLIGR